MQFLDVSSWEEVLRIFKEGRFAGEWGWLEAMRAVDLGENVYFVSSIATLLDNNVSPYSKLVSGEQLANASVFAGHFVEANGAILFVNNENQQVIDPADMLGALKHEGYAVTKSLGRGQEHMDRFYIERHRQYYHVRSVEWNEALNPVEIADMAKVVGAPVMTFALTVTFVTSGVGLCTTIVGCIAGGELAIVGGGSALVSTWYLGQGAKDYVEHYLHSVIEYGP